MSFVFVLGALCAVQAQNKYVKLIDAGHYEKAEAKINRKLGKEPTDMEILLPSLICCQPVPTRGMMPIGLIRRWYVSIISICSWMPKAGRN